MRVEILLIPVLRRDGDEAAAVMTALVVVDDDMVCDFVCVVVCICYMCILPVILSRELLLLLF